jgi:hypothetical protein
MDKRISCAASAVLIVYGLVMLDALCLSQQKTRVESKSQLPEAAIMSSLKVKSIKPVGVVILEGQLVAIDSITASIKKIDVKSGKLTSSVKLAVKSPVGLATDGKAFWVADNTVKKILQVDPKSGAVLKSLEVPIDGDREHTTISAIASDGNVLWVALSAGWSSKILKLDATSGKLIMWVFAECLPRGLATDGKTLYILAYNKGVFPGNVNRMIISDDVKVMSHSNTLLCKTPGKEPSGMVLDGKALWISDKASKSIQKITLP